MKFNREKSMADEERLPLASVLKYVLPTLVEYKLEDLNPASLQNLQKRLNNDFPTMSNSILLDVFQGKQVQRTPVFLVKSSGRYLSEFILLRKSKSYFDLCDNPFAATEASLQPFYRFKPDGIMIFSDFLTLPRAFGKYFEMDLKKGGICLNPLNQPSDIKSLRPINPTDPILMSFYQTIFLTRLTLKGQSAVFGYSGGPFTLFVYIAEKSKSGLFETVTNWMNSRVNESLKILEFITENIIIHIREQIKAGAQIIGLFEIFTELSPNDFEAFSYTFVRRVFSKIKSEYPSIPLVFFAKGQNSFLKKILREEQNIEFDGLLIDHNCDLEEMSLLCDKKDKVLMGNLDPGVLMGSVEIIQEKTTVMLKKGKECKKFVAGLGQGIFEEIDPNHVQTFVEAIRDFK